MVKSEDRAIQQFGGALCSSEVVASEVVASEVDGGTYSFCGTFESVTPMVEGCYYIATDNVIKRLSSTGTIKPYRAYEDVLGWGSGGGEVFDENASNEQPVLSREQPRNYSVWDDEEEEEQ